MIMVNLTIALMKILYIKLSDIDSQLSESFNEVLSDANLLDSSASKSKSQLASSGVMASRRPPSKRNKVRKNQIHELSISDIVLMSKSEKKQKKQQHLFIRNKTQKSLNKRSKIKVFPISKTFKSMFFSFFLGCTYGRFCIKFP
jgi:N-acetylmuramoyl-L-alanine amidase CwlA